MLTFGVKQARFNLTEEGSYSGNKQWDMSCV